MNLLTILRRYNVSWANPVYAKYRDNSLFVTRRFVKRSDFLFLFVKHSVIKLCNIIINGEGPRFSLNTPQSLYIIWKPNTQLEYEKK